MKTKFASVLVVFAILSGFSVRAGLPSKLRVAGASAVPERDAPAVSG